MSTKLMKKVLLLMLISVFILTSVACGATQNQEKSQGDSKEAAKPESVKIRVGTGGVAGAYYAVGGAMTAIWSEKIPGVVATVQASAGGIENIRLMSQKEIEMGFVQTSAAYYAINGLEAFKDKPIKNIKGVAVLFPQAFQLVVDSKSPIKSFADLKGKKVGVGAPGSGEEVTFRELMKVYGMTYDDVDEKMLSLAEQAAALKDGQLDAMWVVAADPAAQILDVASQKKIRVIAFEDEMRDKIIKEYPYHSTYTIKANTYNGQDTDVNTLQSPAYLVVREDMSEETVYQCLRNIYDNLERLSKSHKMAEKIELKNALDGSSISLHPGAEKFYKEKGMIK